MESNSVILCDNLIKWLKTLDLKAKHGTPSELSDGVAIAEALTQIAPEFFTPAWYSKIKTDVGNNWRLKVSNLKKILEGVVDYHQDILNLSLQEFSRPDVGRIAEAAEASDLGRLLQLVLSCAVNCNQKEEYITRIMEMEVACQGSIMQAIQELETLTLGGARVAPPEPAPRVQTDEEVREALAQRCHDLDKQVKVLIEEKASLESEVSRLTAELGAAAGPEVELDDDGTSLGPAHPGTLRYIQMNAKLQQLKNDLDKVELQRDDEIARAADLAREIAMVRLRNEELQAQALENVRLRDEVDALRETAARVATLEASVASYRARMDDSVDLRRQVRILEGEKAEYMRRAIHNEQEALRFQARCGQLDLYRNEVNVLNEKLDQVTDVASEFEIKNKRLSTQVASLQREKEALLQERDTLKETLEELKCSTVSTITADANSSNVSHELMPKDTAERLMRLEHENKVLRDSQAQQQDHAATQELLEDYAKRLEKLRTKNREANQRIMELEATQVAPNAPDVDDAHRISLQVEELQGLLSLEKARVGKLQEEVAARDADLSSLQERYNKSIEKAKQVIESLNPRNPCQPLTDVTLGDPQPTSTNPIGDPTTMKNNTTWSGGGGGGSGRAAQAMESRLLASAWHQLGARCHRDAVDTRLRLLSAGHSFLARQRMQPPRARPSPAPRHAAPAGAHPHPAPAH